MELEFGAVAERFETENLKLFQFEQLLLLRELVNQLDSSTARSEKYLPVAGQGGHRWKLL
jgi:hypothetical protein